MIEQIIITVINELRATGLLVLGLYFLLYRPLRSMALHLSVINGELGEVVQLLKDLKIRPYELGPTKGGDKIWQK